MFGIIIPDVSLICVYVCLLLSFLMSLFDLCVCVSVIVSDVSLICVYVCLLLSFLM